MLINPFTIIFTWKDHDEQALKTQKEIQKITGQCAVIASHEQPENPLPDWVYIGEHAYFTEQWNNLLKLFRSNPQYNTLVHIQADATCDNWSHFYYRLEETKKIHDWFIYSPLVDYSGHKYPPCYFEDISDNCQLIHQTDCTVWAINELVLLQGPESFDEQRFKHGWGLDWFYNQMCVRNNRKIIRDKDVLIDHPNHTSYSKTTAFAEQDAFKQYYNQKDLKISLCTTCGNRQDELQYTVKKNLIFIKEYLESHNQIEWVIIDYNTTDPIAVYDIIKNIDTPGLDVVFKRIEDVEWNISKAKNTAHQAATGDILVNLDADNFIGHGYLEFAHEKFKEDIFTIIHFKWDDYYQECRKLYGMDTGFMGKIALPKSVYKAVNYYPEDIEGYGGDDTDLLNRTRYLPLRRIEINYNIEDWGRTIPKINIDTILKDAAEARNNHQIIIKRENARTFYPTCQKHKTPDLINDRIIKAEKEEKIFIARPCDYLFIYKLQYPHVTCLNADHLVNDNEKLAELATKKCKIVYLYRKNSLFQIALSRKIEHKKPQTFTHLHLIDLIESQRAENEIIINHLPHATIIEIEGNDYFKTKKEINKSLNIISLEQYPNPQYPLSPLSELIENYQQVRAELQNTPYKWMIEDEIC